MWTRRALVGFGAWLLGACGGIVERSSRDAEGGDAAPPTEVPAGEDPEGGIDPGADTALGACVLGFPQTAAKPCAWVADARCYETRQMACNCACPRDRDSQCLSGFEGGPDSRVWVSCN